ncbi:MAG: hypothetical protein HY094_06505 [Candidatus Melainabacteria bacterium]|nr:hypothetical protein [Candidatus Melainabacteria bacterium]
MSAIQPVVITKQPFYADLAAACTRRAENIQKESKQKVERLSEIANFAAELLTKITDRLSKKPQILIDQEARLAREYASQRWFSSQFFGKLYSYSEYKGAVTAKKGDSNVIDFYTDDLDQSFTKNELFLDAVKLLEEEGFITIVKYRYKNHPYERDKRSLSSEVVPVQAKLTRKGKAYLNPNNTLV